VQAAIFANASCDVFTPRSQPCLLGNYVAYAVNVTGPDDIAATIRFAVRKNIRLVVRNTGHDYVGRSTGAGGLGIWTHHLKGVEVKDWHDDGYKGKAIRIGAGTQGFEILAATQKAGLVAVTGECPTVGIAGGYTQSGGHSPLGTAFGLGADNTLEWEVVTPDGRFVRTRPSSRRDSDLFWALSGSGTGNYGVVVAVTLRAHTDAQTSGSSFTISQPGLNHATVLNAWHAALPAILDAGMQATVLATTSYMTVQSITGYNRTQTDLEVALAPFIQSLAAMNIALQPNYTSFASYHDHYLHYFGPLPAGLFGNAGDQLMGGRLLQRSALSSIGPAINATMQLGVQFIGQSLNVARFATPSRAVLPQWRSALVMSAYSMPYSDSVPFADMAARQEYIRDTVMPIVSRVTPDAGAYINEADYLQRDWQQVFYGENYGKLLDVKKRYDPKGLFWNSIAVGSEGWAVRGDGRLCRV
jgi:FAD/FMN-containing dehydrogenase